MRARSKLLASLSHKITAKTYSFFTINLNHLVAKKDFVLYRRTYAILHQREHTKAIYQLK